MASDTRIPKAEITGIYGAMVKWMSRRMLGDVPEPVGVYWHNPRVLKSYFGAPALVELSAFIALANVYTRTNVAFGIEAQGFAAACGLQPLAEPSRNVASAS